MAITAATGVTIKSGKSLQISSDGAMHMSTNQDHKLDATGDVTVQGAAITISAEESVTIEAPSITLKAAGVVQIPKFAGAAGMNANGANPILGSGLAFPLGVGCARRRRAGP